MTNRLLSQTAVADAAMGMSGKAHCGDENPIRYLFDLVAAIQGGALGSPAAGLARWLLAGIEAHLTESVTLDKALGLAGAQGIEISRRRWLRERRNHHLRGALMACEGATPWPRAVALAAEIRRFETTLWPRWRMLEQPPPTASTLRTHLFHAFRTGLPIPATARRLHDIGRRAGVSESKPPF